MNFILKKLKTISSYAQSSKSSFNRHNNELMSDNKLEIERDIAINAFKTNAINSDEFKVDDLLQKNPQVIVGVDIGSGAGWGSVAIAKKLSQVYAIEPSAAGLEISKKLYPEDKFPNITWINGFAEEVLPTLQLSTPTLFLTGCVLSHLRDKEVLKICKAVNNVAPKDSVLSFVECWSDKEWHQIMWHIRTKDWWKKALPDWSLDFHGPLNTNGDYHMGIWGVKNK